MGKDHRQIDDRLRSFIEQQVIFFVATAPLAHDGHVNLSPGGRPGSLPVFGPHTGRLAAVLRELVRPGADRPGERLGDLLDGQRGGDLGWAAARRTQAVYPAAVPRVTPIWWISQARGLYAPSAQYPCPAVNPARIEVRAAVATELARSRPRRHRACSSAAIAVASAAARNASPACTMSIASLTLAGAVMVLASLPGSRVRAGPGVSPGSWPRWRPQSRYL
jgi:hypothetical protein